MPKSLRSLPCIIVLLGLSVASADAQTTYATITGTVTDSSGGVIKGATVVATNVETSVTTKTTTNSDGVYTVTQLREGPYTLSITAPGLREFLAVDIVLVTRDIRRIDAVAAGRRPRGGAAGHRRQRADRARDAAHQRRAHGGAAPDAAAQRSGRLVVSGDHAVAVDARRRLLVRGQPQQPVHVRDRRHVDDRRRRRERHRAARQLHRVVQGSEDRHGEQQRRVAEPRPGHHRLEIGHESLRGRGLRLLPEPDVPGQEPVLGPASRRRHAFPGPRGRRPGCDSQAVRRPRPDVLVRLGGNGQRQHGVGGSEPDGSDRALAAWRLLGARRADPQPVHRRGLRGRPHPAGGVESAALRIQERFYPLPNTGNTATLVANNYRETLPTERSKPYYATARVDHNFSASIGSSGASRSTRRPTRCGKATCPRSACATSAA